MWYVIAHLSEKDLDTVRGQNNSTVCAVVHRSSIESFYLKKLDDHFYAPVNITANYLDYST